MRQIEKRSPLKSWIRVMKGSFIIHTDKEEKDIHVELSLNPDIKQITTLFNSFLKNIGYDLPGYIDFVYYDDLK